MRIAIALCLVGVGCLALWFIHKKEALENATRAYLYAYPLVLMGITQKAMTQNGAKVNHFVHISEFPTDTFKDIVRPNVDTLYSFAWLDLTAGPLVLSVPDTHGRYYLMELMDAWTNVFASLGKRTTGTQAQNFILVGPSWSGPVPDDSAVIYAPTAMVLILARTQTNGKADYAFVHEIQKGYTLAPLGGGINKALPAVESALGGQMAPVDQVAALDIREFYALFTTLLKTNPPALADGSMPDLFKRLNTAQLQQGKERAFKRMAGNIHNFTPVNGWRIMLDIGTYGTHYLTRAMVAQLGIGANIPADAVYPTAFEDEQGMLLTGKNKYVMHFDKGQLPPVKAFWSITLYNAESFLVQNALGRYALGDRDKLHFNNDGSLDIFIQHENPGPGKESNWLPAPDNEFSVTMRLYWPEERVLNGTWAPPGIKKYTIS